MAKEAIEFSLTFRQKLGVVTLAFAIFSTLSFLTTYSFLFGYYFGGEINNSFSNFEVFRRFVPFDVHTITFTYLMISLSVALIIYSLKFLKERGLTFKFLAVFCLAIFHLMMTMFFSQEVTVKNVLLFGAIWVIPLFIGVMSLFFVQGIKSPFKTYSGSILGIVSIIISIMLFNPNLPEEWILIWLNVFLFSFGSLFSRFSYNKYWNFVFVFPYISLAFAIIISITKLETFKEQTDLIKAIIMIGIPLIISIVLSNFFRKKFKENDNLLKAPDESNSISSFILDILVILFNPKTNKSALVFIIIMLLGAYVMTPRVSTSTAKIIRSFTPQSEFQFELIRVKDLNDLPKTIKGIIVAEHEGVIYISNEGWELEQIKTDSYFVEKEND
ncbi:hypothetical protein CN378_10830 [Bacillus sp. AFS015802]|uniref:hypothetical protein n=1 Tax=Bacillus sp. AFS015802 TaxID=2033486 RepID=UPI000BF561AA|nr:hypothetical protein [Bacillus sp. AFS015802]PFA67333.1 hypothetical protein CN378_10830 [Bacillus sp. AFS015802]